VGTWQNAGRMITMQSENVLRESITKKLDAFGGATVQGKRAMEQYGGEMDLRLAGLIRALTFT